MYFHMLLLLRFSILHVTFSVQFTSILIAMPLMCDCHVFLLINAFNYGNRLSCMVCEMKQDLNRDFLRQLVHNNPLGENTCENFHAPFYNRATWLSYNITQTYCGKNQHSGCTNDTEDRRNCDDNSRTCVMLECVMNSTETTNSQLQQQNYPTKIAIPYKKCYLQYFIYLFFVKLYLSNRIPYYV